MKVTLSYLTRSGRKLLAFLFLAAVHGYPCAALKATSLPSVSVLYHIDEITAKRPTSMAISTASVTENRPVGTTVGTFSTVDPDPGSTHTYRLVSGNGSSGNASFSILGNQLLTNTIFNYEVKTSYSIRVRSTDNDGLFIERTFTIRISNVNEAPVATNVNITRSDNRIGTTNNGNFTFTDPDDGSSQGIHIYKWYRLLSGGDTGLIAGATSKTYIPVLTDGGSSVCFEITPTDNYGLSGMPVKSKFQYVNAVPSVSDVNIYAPDVSINRYVYGRFAYTDLENNAAGDHICRWYRSSEPTGTGTLISNATDTIYRLTSTDDTRYIRFAIAPAASAGSTPGAAVTSVWIGPIGIPIPKATISGTDITCPGDAATLQVVLEGTPPFSITYLRNGTDPKTIGNIRELNYSLQVVGNGTYTLSAVSDLYRKGRVYGSGVVTHYVLPTATISGNTTMCEFASVSLSVSLTGTAPWNFSYHRSTDVPTTVYNVYDPVRLINVNRGGIYTLTDVSDKNCHGTYSGSATVTAIPAPDVSITGLESAYSIKELMVPVFGHPENGFFTPALLVRYDTNYFMPAFVGVGLHTIIYSYLDGGTGCFGYDTAVVAVLDANADITFPDNDLKKFFCYNDPPFTIMGHNINNRVGSFNISGGTGLTDHHNNSATINPSLLPGGIYEITYRYFDQIYLEVKDSFEIESVDNIRFIGFDESSYCNNGDPVELNGNAPGGGVFSGRAVTGNASTGYYFEPKYAGPVSDTVYYSYTTERGCSRQIFKSVIIKDAADINFTVMDSCISSSSADSTAFINLTTTTDPVISWEWDFGDINSGDNYSSLENPKHRYTKESYKRVSLTATTQNNCRSSKVIFFNFGDNPVADFSWATECFHEGNRVLFINNSSLIGPGIARGDHKWKFYTTGSAYDSIDTENAEYLYSEPGNYEVALIVRSSHGCTDTVRRLFSLRHTHPLVQGETYVESFDNGMAGWISTSADTVNSWTLGEPEDIFTGPVQNTKFWYTDITAEQPFREQSYVTSPCFDFRGLDKPMIRLNLWRLFNINMNDGAVLQYTVDSGKHWVPVGDLDDGVNWYRDYRISGNPGNQSIGWSSTSLDAFWVEARHSLDPLKGKTDVQLRMAYGSDGTAKGTKGLAFDNISIGERNKIALIEHFTNAGDNASRLADAQLDAFIHKNPLDIIDIQYHTSFPGIDPFNEQNKADPGTRVLFYQLSDVPVSILNGGTGSGFIFDYTDRPLDTTLIKNQSLLDPKFSIGLQTTRQDNSLTIDAELRPLQILSNRQVTLHITIIERKITSVTGANGDTEFESVLRTIISSTSYTNNWDPAVDFKTVTENWSYKNTYNTDEIRVIAFVQDEATREIYQSMIDIFDVGTALDEENEIHRSRINTGFIVFPNPVRDEVYLRFAETPLKAVRVELYDINGKLALHKELLPGNKQYVLSLKKCPEGFFFLTINSDDQFIGLQKLVISR